MSFCCHSEQRSDEESTISPPPGERHREWASQFNSRRLNSPSQSPDLTNKNACTTLCISGPPPNDATAPKITKCCRMLQKQENSSDGQPLVASSLDRIQPSPNFTITRKMSQNASHFALIPYPPRPRRRLLRTSTNRHTGKGTALRTPTLGRDPKTHSAFPAPSAVNPHSLVRGNQDDGRASRNPSTAPGNPA